MAADAGTIAIERAQTATAAVPWYIWCCAAAVLSGAVGGGWDISWHESIGRDTFWTAAHMCIYLCGMLAGGTCGYLILSTSLRGTAGQRDAAVRVWGFHGPLGAFLCAWGGVAMITSAPFDNWWHGAYGLDVKILSPPHALLISGMLVIRVGTLLLIAGELSRASGALRPKLRRLMLYVFSALIAGSLGSFQELMLRNFMHSARFYLLAALLAPLFLTAAASFDGGRWAATAVVALYMVYYMGLMWILPLFPAEPKLGPVFQHVTHFVPPQFPLLILAPAVAMDWVRARVAGMGRWAQSAVLGTVFVAVFAAVQWPTANFLMSPASANWFFAGHAFPYFVPSTTDWVRGVFTPVEQTAAQFWEGMGAALALAMACSRAGMAFGEWLRDVRR